MRAPPTFPVRLSVYRTYNWSPMLMAPAHRLATSVSQYTWTPTLLPGVGDQYTLADCGAIHLGRSVVLQQNKNIKVSTDIPPFFPFLNLSSPPPTLDTFCSGCFCSGVCQDNVLALGKIKSENQEGVPASFAPPLEMRGRRRDACSLAVALGSRSCGSRSRLLLLA